MPQLSGVWLLNNILDFSDIDTVLEEDVTMSANYIYDGVLRSASGTKCDIYPNKTISVYTISIEPPIDFVPLPQYIVVYRNGWVSDLDIGIRKVDFGSIPVDVSERFFNFVTKNGRQLEGITNGFEISLLKNTAEQNRVDKTNFIDYVDIVYGVLRDSASITNPSITIQYDNLVDFNYVYIPVFNRYYYVTDINILSNKLYELSLTVDVLMSYRDSILNCVGFVDRCEEHSNPNIIDKKRVIEQGVDVQVVELSQDLFEREQTYDLRYVLNGYKINAVAEG